MTDQAEMAVESVPTQEPVQDIAVDSPETGASENLDAELSEALQEGESTEESVEFVEIEIEGVKYEVPKELEDGYLRQADYTRKTQEVAETRKTIEQQQWEVQQAQQQFQQRQALQQANLQAYAQLASLDGQLQQFASADWQTIIDNDPVEAQKLQAQYQNLKDQRAGLAGQISQYEQQVELQNQQATAQVMEQAMQQLKTEIPDWSPDTGAQITEYAKAQGLSDVALQQLNSAMFGADSAPAIKLINKARLYDQMLAKAQQQPKAEVDKKPTRRVSSGRTADKNPSKMSTEEWMAWRNSQM